MVETCTDDDGEDGEQEDGVAVVEAIDEVAVLATLDVTQQANCNMTYVVTQVTSQS